MLNNMSARGGSASGGKKLIPYILIIIILAIVGLVAYKSYSSNRSNKSNGANEPNGSNKTNQTNNSNGSSASTDLLSYTHPDLGFTISYPGNYKITDLADDQGETILLQDNGKGAQVYISDFAGKDFNSALVRSELGEKLNNLKDIVMPGGFNAVSFSGQDKALGEVWDVWFVQNGKLYQITSEPGQEKLLKSLVESFKFE
jgi:hypothetical protein